MHGVGQDPRGIAGTGRVAQDRSVSLGAADDQQQLQIEAPSAGHRAPSAPHLAGVVALRVARPRGGVADPDTASAGQTGIWPGDGCQPDGGGG